MALDKLLNSNIRCIEIRNISAKDITCNKLNSNIRCIEMEFTL